MNWWKFDDLISKSLFTFLFEGAFVKATSVKELNEILMYVKFGKKFINLLSESLSIEVCMSCKWRKVNFIAGSERNGIRAFPVILVLLWMTSDSRRVGRVAPLEKQALVSFLASIMCKCKIDPCVLFKNEIKCSLCIFLVEIGTLDHNSEML